MREIKFRAWDKKEKRMLHWDEEPYLGFFIGDYGDILQGAFEDIVKQQKLELMQYTGLKDMNGKEIYEGDIVRENNELGISELFYKIGYKDGHTSMTGCNKGNEYDKHGIWNLISSLEVIGNIYETPDLLKETK